MALAAASVVTLALIPPTSVHAARARIAWSEREQLDWFKSAYSCHVQAAIDTAMARTFTVTTSATDERHADIVLRAQVSERAPSSGGAR